MKPFIRSLNIRERKGYVFSVCYSCFVFFHLFIVKVAPWAYTDVVETHPIMTPSSNNKFFILFFIFNYFLLS